MLTMFLLATVVLFTGCEKDDFVETVGVCPIVTATTPVDGATGVPLDQEITATFNVEMDPATFNQASFIVQDSAPIDGVITFSGVAARFIPNTPLASNTTYTVVIKTTVKDLNGNALQEDYVWAFSTGALLTPMVASTDPAADEINVFLNKVVTATFNMEMDPTTINASTFTLSRGTTAVAGAVTYAGTKASFNPTNALMPNTEYTATITTGAENTDGTSITENYVWKFTTGTLVAPRVTSTDPANEATNVALNKTATATFDVAMDPLTINNATFTLRNGATTVVGTVTYSGLIASFNPTTALLPNTEYTATITTGARNTNGTSIASNYIWRFTTGILVAPRVTSTDPANQATNVALNKTVTATFDGPMDPLTISNATFTLRNGAANVTGVVSYAGTIATFNPSADLMPATVYTATITTGARNVAGTPLAANYVWTFTTAAAVTPQTDFLKSAGNFGILAGVGISNNAGFSVINNMNVGISPGVRSSITGFPPAIVVNGFIYASDDVAPVGIAAVLQQAKQDLSDAYLLFEGMAATATVSGDQGGLTRTPGVYKSTSTLSIQSGNLTLDAQGDPNAIFVFQIASAFTTVGGAGGNVILTNGAQAKNVYWQTGSSATIGDGTSFRGNVLALTSITMGSTATAVGRMLASNGAVVMTNTNTITKP